MSLAHAGIQREPGGDPELIFSIDGHQAARGIVDFGERRALALALRWVTTDQTKRLVIVLRKPI